MEESWLIGNRKPTGRILIRDGGLKKKKENGISAIYTESGQCYPFRLGDLSSSFPFQWPPPNQCQYSQPESRILGMDIHVNDCKVFVGFEDKNNQILPLQDSTDSIKLVCTGRCCHRSSKHRDICFGPLFFLFSTIQGHLWFLRLTGSYLTVGYFCSLCFPPLSHPPRLDSTVVLSNRTFFAYGNVLHMHCPYTVTTSPRWLFSAYKVDFAIMKLHFFFIPF